ncbi:uncharacterized protein C2orf15 homolog isoform X1 [Onychomys torridus]|uniref:uncharacterized protein C2orf15 homolog isoform X1 n=1 Tax=Onychomys torridus TaxID=38674 RepID=UPI00167F989B|nr:uncharacterized protein C2orf15 homolog isoform X1 [Onychomys torridus]
MADPCVLSPSNHPLARAFTEAARRRMRGGRPFALEHTCGFEASSGSLEPEVFPAERNGYLLELLGCGSSCHGREAVLCEPSVIKLKKHFHHLQGSLTLP